MTEWSKHLEPVAKDIDYEHAPIVSIAISLKRIADTLARLAEPESDDTYRQRIAGASVARGVAPPDGLVTAIGVELDGYGQIIDCPRR